MDCGSGARVGSWGQGGARSMLGSMFMGSRVSIPDWVDRSRGFGMNRFGGSVGTEEEVGWYGQCGCWGILSEKGCVDG